MNLITDVPGLKIGQAEDVNAMTGVTVLYPDVAAVCGVDVRGGGPGDYFTITPQAQFIMPRPQNWGQLHRQQG
jgi:L-aminopeptidase/D-esterase-like protein